MIKIVFYNINVNYSSLLLVVCIGIIWVSVGCSGAFITLDEVRLLNQNGDYEKSIEYSLKVLESDENNLQFLRELGIAYYNMGLLHGSGELRDSSKATFARMIKIDKDNIFGLKSLGIICYDENLCSESYQYISKALSHKTLDGKIYFNSSKRLNDFDVDSKYLRYLRARTCAYLDCKSQIGIKDIEFCIMTGYILKQSYLVAGILNNKFSRYEKSCDYFNRAKLLGNKEADSYIYEFCR